MVKLGKTKNGTEVFINKMVLENENIIVIGSVEPHYFAGYTGGRKSFFPGISSYKTIEMNHKFALSNKACSINLEDNPVHIDFNDAIKLLKNINIFSIQTVLTNDYKIYSIKCGDIIKSFNSALNYANQIYLVPIENKGNIVVTVAPNPMDINLYQSQHALENGSLALERDGILILISKCREGVGNDSFLDLLSKAKNFRDAINLIGDNYKLGIHKSVRILKIKSKFQLFAVTDLDNQIIKNAKFEPFSNIQIAIDEAIKQIEMRKKIPKIIIIPYGNLTIPKIMKNKN
jgi:nickel-dependent lactate racemase